MLIRITGCLKVKNKIVLHNHFFKIVKNCLALLQIIAMLTY